MPCGGETRRAGASGTPADARTGADAGAAERAVAGAEAVDAALGGGQLHLHRHLQIAGLPFDADRVLLRGDPASGKFAVFHLKGDQVQSVEAINSPPEFMMGKQLIANRKPIIG